MRLAVFSDIHGNLPALQAVFRDIKRQACDEIFCLGDTVAIGPQSAECLSFIAERKITALLGNHELYALRGTTIDGKMSQDEILHQNYIANGLTAAHKRYMAGLPLSVTREYGGCVCRFQHFFIKEEGLSYPFHSLKLLSAHGELKQAIEISGGDVLFIGHQHQPFERCEGGRRVYCVGSSGCCRDGFTHYFLVDVENGSVSVRRRTVEYDRARLKEELAKSDMPCKSMIAGAFFNFECNL